MASSLAGQLAVNVVANTGKFNKGIRSARKQLKGFETSVVKASKFLVKLGSIATAAGVGFATVFVKNTLSSVDALAKQADKLDISIEKLQEFQFAAKTVAGVSETVLNTALQRMSRRVGEASLGFGAAKATLERLNLNAMFLKTLRADEQFIKIGNAIKKITDREQQLAAVTGIFDMEAAQLVNLFAAGVEDAGKAFREMGGAITPEQADRIESLNTTLTTMKTLATLRGNKLVIEMAPHIETAVKALKEVVDGVALLIKAPTEESKFAFEERQLQTIKGKTLFERGQFKVRREDIPRLSVTGFILSWWNDEMDKFDAALSRALKDRAASGRIRGSITPTTQEAQDRLDMLLPRDRSMLKAIPNQQRRLEMRDILMNRRAATIDEQKKQTQETKKVSEEVGKLRNAMQGRRPIVIEQAQEF
jgi:hypothetical protein